MNITEVWTVLILYYSDAVICTILWSVILLVDFGMYYLPVFIVFKLFFLTIYVSTFFDEF